MKILRFARYVLRGWLEMTIKIERIALLFDVDDTAKTVAAFISTKGFTLSNMRTYRKTELNTPVCIVDRFSINDLVFLKDRKVFMLLVTRDAQPFPSNIKGLIQAEFMFDCMDARIDTKSMETALVYLNGLLEKDNWDEF